MRRAWSPWLPAVFVFGSEHRGDFAPGYKSDWGWFNWKRTFNLLVMELVMVCVI